MVSDSESLAFAGPIELARLVREGSVHPRELVELFLRRIEAINPSLNAFRLTAAEEALRLAEGDLDGPLAGVPFAVKDDLAVAGHATTYGSRAPAPTQNSDAEVVRRLRVAGAIPVGITNVPELMIFPWTASDANGITRNPWDRSRTPGGSSGGSAAAVAAGMVAFATASDGGGSIRIPAACCGLVGMKPSRGRVSTAPAAQGWLGLSTYGALARTVADSAALLDVLGGNLPGDRDRLPPPERPYRDAAAQAPGALRIAVSRKLPPGVLGHLSSDQSAALERTAALLEQLGHRVDQRDPSYGQAGLLFTRAYLGAIAADLEEMPAEGPFERTTRRMAATGRVILPRSRRASVREGWSSTTARILALWDDVDVLVTPGLATTALPAEGGYGKSALTAFRMASAFTPWTAAFNLTGQPALTIPAGVAADGLPTSVQLVAAAAREDLLYSLAAQIEAADPWAARTPSAVGVR